MTKRPLICRMLDMLLGPDPQQSMHSVTTRHKSSAEAWRERTGERTPKP